MEASIDDCARCLPTEGDEETSSMTMKVFRIFTQCTSLTQQWMPDIRADGTSKQRSEKLKGKAPPNIP
jgi:hypothetical protein